MKFETSNVESLCGRKTELCEELSKRRVVVCCRQEVRRKVQGAHFVGTQGHRYKSIGRETTQYLDGLESW